GLFGVLCVWAYYFLPDFIAKRRAGREKPPVETVATSAGADNPGTSPAAEAQVTPAQDDKTLAGGAQPPPEPLSPQNPRASDDRLEAVPPLKAAEGVVRPPRVTTLVKPPPRPADASSRSGLTIQVGSFKDQGEADARASSLNAATDGAFHVVEAAIPGRGTWYRVQKVEGFGSRESALSYGNRLRGRNLISDFIVTTR
ncbi:MAG TPA: SPOR domain-containing protein, partial [Blastocatellia bacterium]|nr:SPOR domain-containing protein [Blastocatellia bacterium]